MRAQAKALMPILGTRARVYEVMHKTRALSPRMVNGLWKKSGIPLDVLVNGMITSKNKSSRPPQRKREAPGRRNRQADTTRTIIPR